LGLLRTVCRFVLFRGCQGIDLGVCEVLFLAVAFLLRLGLVGEIKGDPCTVKAISEPLVGALSAEESMSLS